MTGLTNNPTDVRRSVYPHDRCRVCLNGSSVVSTFFQAAVESCERCGRMWDPIDEASVKGVMAVWNEKKEGCESPAKSARLESDAS